MNGRLSKLVVALALSATSLLAQATETPLARLRIDGKKVGWDGIDLGMSIVQAERRLATSLALTETGGACGKFVVVVERGTLRLTLGFPSPRPGAKIESLYVHFEGYQVLAERDALVAELKRVAPQATYIAPASQPELAEAAAPYPAYLVDAAADIVAVVEPGAGLRLTKHNCLS